MPLATPERGYPFVALAVLIVVIASPVISLGGARSRGARAGGRRAVDLLPVAGAAAAAAGARRGRAAGRRAGRARCRWRRRPTAASRGSTTARSRSRSGPTTRCASRGRRATGRSTGRARATRSCAWSPASRCTGRRATSTTSTASRGRSPSRRRARAPFDERFEADLPEDWRNRPAWTETVEFNIKRMRTTDVIGAGTTVNVKDPSRTVREGLSPGHLGRAERAAPQRLLHGRGPRPAAGHRADVGGDHRRGRAPGRRARADPPVQAGRVRDPDPRRLLALQPGDRRRDALRAVGQRGPRATPSTRRSAAPTATSTP